MLDQETNVVAFKPRAAVAHHPKSLLERIYAAGSLSIRADDRATKVMATRLQVFGFVVIDEVQADGSIRRLRPSEAVKATLDHPWRVSKPSGRWSVAGATSADDLFHELSLP